MVSTRMKRSKSMSFSASSRLPVSVSSSALNDKASMLPGMAASHASAVASASPGLPVAISAAIRLL